jgi:hypothetical protein
MHGSLPGQRCNGIQETVVFRKRFGNPSPEGQTI